MISVELKRWAHLLNDLQDQSLGSTEIATDFDVVALACDLIALIRSQITKTIGLEVQAAQSFWVHLPETALQQALLNLVLNAAEAVDGSADGHILIKITQSESELLIRVLDNGAGFSQNLLDRGIAVLDADSQATTGTGLIKTQQWLKNIGGRIKLSNQQPHGACVTVFLPAESILKNK